MEIRPENRSGKGILFTLGGVLIAISVIVYGISFFQPAFITNDGLQPIPGYMAFITGLFGLAMLHTTWLANPAFWIGLILVACRSWKAATAFAVFATGFALAALAIYEPGAAPPPHHCTSLSGIEKIRLATILPGYWYWLTSMVLFLSGCTVQFAFHRSRTKTSVTSVALHGDGSASE